MLPRATWGWWYSYCKALANVNTLVTKLTCSGLVAVRAFIIFALPNWLNWVIQPLFEYQQMWSLEYSPGLPDLSWVLLMTPNSQQWFSMAQTQNNDLYLDLGNVNSRLFPKLAQNQAPITCPDIAPGSVKKQSIQLHWCMKLKRGQYPKHLGPL